MGVALAEASGDGDPLLAPLEGFGDTVRCEAVDGAAMSTVDFDRRYLAKAFPAVLRGLTDGWAAMEEGGSRRWDLDFFRREYGELPVQVDAGGDTFGARRQLTMAEYIDAFDDLTAAAEEAGASPPPYLRTWNYEDEVPELGSDWSTPALFRDMFQALPPVARPPFTWLFLCPRGATTRLHVDVWHTDAWLVNALGRKRFVLFHPAQRKYIEDGQGFVDLRSPDLERFPDLAKATPVEFVLGPGEIAYIPRKWPHFAVALEPSVSVSLNAHSRAPRAPSSLALTCSLSSPSPCHPPAQPTHILTHTPHDPPHWQLPSPLAHGQLRVQGVYARRAASRQALREAPQHV